MCRVSCDAFHTIDNMLFATRNFPAGKRRPCVSPIPHSLTHLIIPSLAPLHAHAPSASHTLPPQVVIQPGAKPADSFTITWVVTHGTATLEETAYFLSLTLKIDVSAACPITQVVVHEVTNA